MINRSGHTSRPQQPTACSLNSGKERPSTRQHIDKMPSPMHIVIDLQGAQSSGSRHRGIGNYSEELALTLARLVQGKHRISLVLNLAFAETIDPIREAFSGLIAAQDVHIWQPLTPCCAHDSANAWRRTASEALYATFLRTLKPDVLLVTSLFEGFVDDALIGIQDGGDIYATAVVLYDLIPYIYPKPYLENPSVLAWYHNRIAHARHADLLLTISESSRQEALNYLGSEDVQVVNISSAINPRFRVAPETDSEAEMVRARYGLHRPFVMYTGGIDHRKNVEGLIAAYATLPAALRAEHHLAVVCSANEHARKKLTDLAARHGLAADELVLTGFVPDDDLVALYNLCTLFVFPSWHEGFGLPALEAMACGAPTIASNCSSLPEVIGWEEALFDPLDTAEIARAITRGLTDVGFRTQLKAHAAQQARQFSWEATARRALAALIELGQNHRQRFATDKDRPIGIPVAGPRRRLAYVSPLQAAKTGIADYSAELLPELAQHYDIDVVVEQIEPLTDPWVLGNAQVLSVAAFEQHVHRYDRILYHFGNSHYHQHMFDLLERHPGVVVLHDFFLSSIREYMDVHGYAPGAWARSLLHAHGWRALQHRFEADDIADVRHQWPCNLDVIQRALGVIVHAEYSRILADQWYGTSFADDWKHIPHLRVPVAETIRQDQRRTSRAALGLGVGDVLVCSFGLLGETKLSHRLVEAWLQSSLATDLRCQLVFVGQASGEYGEQMHQQIRAGQGRIRITGWVDKATFRQYLASADIAVQLRTLSRGETSGTVLDCMNYGVATIVNANGSMAELPQDTVWRLDDAFDTSDLVQALERLRRDVELRTELGALAIAHIRTRHKPSRCAAQYAQIIEAVYARAQQAELALAERVKRLGPPDRPPDLARLAEASTQIFPPKRPPLRQLLVDISVLHQLDAKSGIQRMVRGVLKALLVQPHEGFRIEPVYATPEHGYLYARRFTARFLGLGEVPLDDTPIFARAGDVFWGLDLAPGIVSVWRTELNALRLRGVKVVFTVYDLFPITLPETCAIGAAQGHAQWLGTLSGASDGLLCISKTVSDQLKQWLIQFGPTEGHALLLGWVPLGADVDNAQPRALSVDERELLATIASHPVFLMVGTVESRKAYAQALAAFERLWQQNESVSLVIVGKQGWLVDTLVARLRRHPMRGKHLFWLEGIDDYLLEQMYTVSTCLIAASLDEGFGLPLVEAARHNLSILARDIPVFREVAGEHASYFSGTAPQDLAEAVLDWLRDHRAGRAPKSEGLPWLNWKQATAAMLDMILQDRWQDAWQPEKDDTLVARYWGSDPRLESAVGERKGMEILSCGQAGYLLYGPYINLKPGHYTATIRGRVGVVGLKGALADVCIEGGSKILTQRSLLAGTGAVGGEHDLAILSFSLKDACNGMEVRVNVGAHDDVAISLVEIRKTSPSAEARSGNLDAPKTGVGTTFSAIQTPRLTYWATHSDLQTQVGIAVGRSLYTSNQKGFLIYGPYAGLPAGVYTLRLLGQLRQAGNAWVDISAERGKIVIVRSPLQSLSAASNTLAVVPFRLNGYVDDLEVRLHVDEATDLSLDAVIVEMRSETETDEPNFKK